MGPNAAISADQSSLAARLAHLAAADGTSAHPHAGLLRRSAAPRRDLADAVHALCAVHGARPGAAEEARRRAGDPWLDRAADLFAAERAVLARLCSAAGPLPSTPGQSATEAALAGQRHALGVLAASDRQGCALGVVAALALDWCAVRPVLYRAAAAFGLSDDVLPNPTAGVEDALARAVARGVSERAVLFGAEQLLAQHRGLWSLLEARADARPS